MKSQARAEAREEKRIVPSVERIEMDILNAKRSTLSVKQRSEARNKIGLKLNAPALLSIPLLRWILTSGFITPEEMKTILMSDRAKRLNHKQIFLYYLFTDQELEALATWSRKHPEDGKALGNYKSVENAFIPLLEFLRRDPFFIRKRDQIFAAAKLLLPDADKTRSIFLSKLKTGPRGALVSNGEIHRAVKRGANFVDDRVRETTLIVSTVVRRMGDKKPSRALIWQAARAEKTTAGLELIEIRESIERNLKRPKKEKERGVKYV